MAPGKRDCWCEGKRGSCSLFSFSSVKTISSRRDLCCDECTCAHSLRYYLTKRNFPTHRIAYLSFEPRSNLSHICRTQETPGGVRMGEVSTPSPHPHTPAHTHTASVNVSLQLRCPRLRRPGLHFLVSNAAAQISGGS